MRDGWLAQARKIAEQAPHVPTQYIEGGSYVADYSEAYQRYRSEVVRERRQEASPERLYVRFDGPPSHDSGRFVELETEAGRSVGPEESGAHWYLQDDGTWLLGPFARAEEVGVTDERLCARCGDDIGDDYCVRCDAPPEAAPSTDEGEAGWWVDTWCDKHDGFHLQHGENGSRIVVADEKSGEMVCQLLNEAAAIRAPLEERIETLQRKYDSHRESWEAWAQAAEERIRERDYTVNLLESEARQFHASISRERAENEGLREALRLAWVELDLGDVESAKWHLQPYLATPPSATEGTGE